MRIDDARRGEESRIGNPIDAYLAVVVRHVFQQPFDRVVGVGALINIFRRVGPIELRRHIDEASLGLITPADILEYEDVSGALECLRLRQPSAVMVLAVW